MSGRVCGWGGDEGIRCATGGREQGVWMGWLMVWVCR